MAPRAWLKYLALSTLVVAPIALCGGCSTLPEDDEVATTGPAAGQPTHGGEAVGMVLIGSVPDEAAQSAWKSLEANGIDYEFDGGLGATSFRVDSTFAAKAKSVLSADAKLNSYTFTQSK